MTEHTPGPWIADYRGVYRGVYAAKGTTDTGYGAMIADCPRAAGPYGALEASANADLIAAAPDLLAAAEGVLPWLAGINTKGDPAMVDALTDVYMQLAAAIKKAKGQ